MTILLIDDEDNLRTLMAKVLELEGYSVLQARNLQAGWKQAEPEEVALIITDVRLPDGNGVEFAGRLKQRYPAKEVIVLTAYGNIADGVQAIRNGAFDYLTKSDHQERLIPLVSKAFEKATLQHRLADLEQKLKNDFGFSKIIGTSSVIREAIALAQKIAHADQSVLLTGETGTGKEVFANALHYESPRKHKSLVAINCSAIAKDLLESELFGYAAGAFTHATKDKRGLLEEAQNGSLFLDEVGELTLELQAKLLRVLETGEYYRVGDARVRKANVRVIAATNRDLEKEIEMGHFRSDLFYRLAVFQLALPSLRERPEDIPLLAAHFLQLAAAKSRKRIMGMDADFLAALQAHAWKGNIRELKNVIERCVILTQDTQLTASLLPSDFNTGAKATLHRLADVEREHIKNMLRLAEGNKTRAAKLLDIGLTTLYQKIKDYNL